MIRVAKTGVTPSFCSVSAEITEIWYRDKADMEAMWKRAREPEVAAEMDADGAKFMDPAMRFYIVEEFC